MVDYHLTTCFSLNLTQAPYGLSPLPQWNQRVLFVLSPTSGGLPGYYGGSASTTTFRGLLGVHSRYSPHEPLIP
jgi:hypothetical protein